MVRPDWASMLRTGRRSAIVVYRITGIGLEAVEISKPTLAEAARTASKMIDQGVADVKVFDAAGLEVTKADLDQAWWDSARSS